MNHPAKVFTNSLVSATAQPQCSLSSIRTLKPKTRLSLVISTEILATMNASLFAVINLSRVLLSGCLCHGWTKHLPLQVKPELLQTDQQELFSILWAQNKRSVEVPACTYSQQKPFLYFITIGSKTAASASVACAELKCQ